MYVVNEDGSAAANLEQALSVQMGQNNQTGEAVLLAQYAGGLLIILASGGDRPRRAAEEIGKALKAGRRYLDLNDLLGDRPSVIVPNPGQIILPGAATEGPATGPKDGTR